MVMAFASPLLRNSKEACKTNQQPYPHINIEDGIARLLEKRKGSKVWERCRPKHCLAMGLAKGCRHGIRPKSFSNLPPCNHGLAVERIEEREK
jgi:hypothetical protein